MKEKIENELKIEELLRRSDVKGIIVKEICTFGPKEASKEVEILRKGHPGLRICAKEGVLISLKEPLFGQINVD